MPFYHLHMTDGVLRVPDVEGVECADAAAVIAYARADAEDLRRHATLPSPRPWWFEVTDEAGQLLDTVAIGRA